MRYAILGIIVILILLCSTAALALDGDANGDNAVDIFDLVMVAQDFGRTNCQQTCTDPRADVTGDGTVDIFDLVLVAQNFGNTGPGGQGCQDQGYRCCVACSSGHKSQLDDTCPVAEVCCTFCQASISCTTSNCVDFGNAVGTVGLIYGANEDNNWYSFAHNAINQQRHREAGTRSLRVWLSAQSYRQSTFPYDGTSYDWGNVDDFIDAALKASVGDNPPLYITFAHYDICGSGGSFNFNRGCEGHNEPAPTNNQDFADYVVNVINHFIDKCNAGQYANGKPCDPVNDWYYEILNEPNSISQSNYKAIVNTVHNTLISGGIGDLKLAAYHRTSDINGADFSVTHNYPGNVCDGSSNQQKMDCAGDISQNSYGDPAKPLINSEYADSWGYCYTDFAASWYAAVLIDQIKYGIHMEHWYFGTGDASGLPSSGGNIYGMWGRDGTPWPVHEMKKQFVISHPSYPNPATRYNDDISGGFYVLATQRLDGKRFITIVNSKGSSNNLNLEIVNAASGSQTLNLQFSGFEAKFLEESTDGSWNEVLSING
jgi:hypothetical protein